MQTVEQIQNTAAADGLAVPMENGNTTGEANVQGSDAESLEGAKREWEQIIQSDRFHALYTAHVSDIIKKRLKAEKHSSELIAKASALLGLENPEQLPEQISKLMAPAQRDWKAEEAAVQEKYPELDLQKQQENQAFASLLQGLAKSPEISLTQAYELFSLDSLQQSAAQSAAKDTALQLMGAVRIRHQRPDENGIGAYAASSAGRAARLTRAQRAVLAERAAKGEHITF